MPATAFAKIGRDFLTGTSGRGQLPYTVQGANSFDEAVVAIAAVAPTSVTQGGMTFTLDGIGAVETTDHGPSGQGLWEGYASYRNADIVPLQVGDKSFSFTTTGGTQHVTYSKEAVRGYGTNAQQAPDFDNAIGVNENGGIDGVDIGVRQFSFTETRIVSASSLTVTYLQRLYRLTDCVNTVTVPTRYGPMEPGELVFKGAHGTPRDQGKVELNLDFEASPNASVAGGNAITLGPFAPIEKKGWEYLWVYYVTKEDTTLKYNRPVPTYALVERVYEEGDLNLLGIW